MLVRSHNPIEGGPAIWIEGRIHAAWQVLRLMRQLREYPADAEVIDVVIDGRGGDCGLGLETYTLLRDEPRRTRVTIFQAQSMHSIIAMAGDEVRITERGSIFVHNVGQSLDRLVNEIPAHLTASVMRALARRCDSNDSIHAAILARRTGLPLDQVKSLLERETTFDAAEAVRLGFADRIVKRTAA